MRSVGFRLSLPTSYDIMSYLLYLSNEKEDFSWLVEEASELCIGFMKGMHLF